MNYQHGLFSWADVSTPDPAAGAAFYATLFGWAAEEQHDPDGNYIYTMFSRDGKATAGLGPQPEQMKEQNLPSAWNSCHCRRRRCGLGQVGCGGRYGDDAGHRRHDFGQDGNRR